MRCSSFVPFIFSCQYFMFNNVQYLHTYIYGAITNAFYFHFLLVNFILSFVTSADFKKRNCIVLHIYNLLLHIILIIDCWQFCISPSFVLDYSYLPITNFSLTLSIYNFYFPFHIHTPFN